MFMVNILIPIKSNRAIITNNSVSDRRLQIMQHGAISVCMCKPNTSDLPPIVKFFGAVLVVQPCVQQSLCHPQQNAVHIICDHATYDMKRWMTGQNRKSLVSQCLSENYTNLYGHPLLLQVQSMQGYSLRLYKNVHTASHTICSCVYGSASILQFMNMHKKCHKKQD